ncbi:type IX secretion system periplasmic lipoprotein PorW/SprE [Aquirufa regiilacus]|uniref:Tetratricopeptide repeat protein n=1 Tax=Aquirufa regiilacus TaxID=3024868 RepID=A0ABU3TU11_9BACT|nr:tetratricopeptide repeat protein [Aquirufa sp. LEOWEIH-7C]MDU0809343.1 tetratricopeptide repeat protein [Aquirufa sp. LEOWEIH-7C]
MIRILSVVLVLLVTWSCSQHSTKPAAVTFHNINAKYNAIWQADRLLISLHNQLVLERVENFANELPIFAPVDSAFGISHKLEIGNLIRKASLVIDRHQNSAYLDDAYLLIAEGRLLQKDYKNAVETLKYINTLTPDTKTQTRALTLLYQTYLIQNDFESAEQAEAFLIENELTGTDYALAKAFEHQQKGEITASINALNQMAGKIKNRGERSRMYFILGQLNERINQGSQAKEAYQNSMRQKSNYELTLRANIAFKSLDQSIPALEKMLADPKNEDQKSEIYVSIGKIYLEQKDLDQAKIAWEKATKNNPNKGELYYQLANLFANQIKDYPKASAYFDSAAISLSNTHPSYVKAQKLKKDWNKYVELASKIQHEDSLQKLAKMPLSDLQTLYKQTQAKKNQRSDSLQKIQAQPQKMVVTFTRRPASSDQQSFYFYNEQARIKGEQEFSMKWGIRNLEDFWNRKNKQNTTISTNTNQTIELTEKSNIPSASLQMDSMDIWLNNIPTTEAKLLASNKTKEQALFELGKYCKTQMGENALARQQLKRLLNEFPYSSFEAEALYLLYLSAENRQEKPNTRNVLFDRFPDSIYKLTILQLETGTLSDTKEVQAEKAYESAYLLFKSNEFDAALRACQQLRINYPGSKSEDKIVFLSALCQAGLKNTVEYEKTLKQFVQLFPLSPLKAEAEGRINAIPKK